MRLTKAQITAVMLAWMALLVVIGGGVAGVMLSLPLSVLLGFALARARD